MKPTVMLFDNSQENWQNSKSGISYLQIQAVYHMKVTVVSIVAHQIVKEMNHLKYVLCNR